MRLTAGNIKQGPIFDSLPFKHSVGVNLAIQISELWRPEETDSYLGLNLSHGHTTVTKPHSFVICSKDNYENFDKIK